MAPNIWDNSDADNDGNNANNWSLGNVPQAGDVATFDNTSDDNCTFSGNITCDGLSAEAGYDGNIDFGDSMTHAYGASGLVFDHAGDVDMGTGTGHTITDGPFDYLHVGGTFTSATSTVTLEGVCELVGSTNDYLNNLTIAGGATVTDGVGSGWVGTSGVMTINGSVDLTSQMLRVTTNGTIVLGGSAVVSSTLLLWILQSGAGITSNAGATVTGTVQVYAPKSGAVIAPGTYSHLLIYLNGTWIASAGSYTFSSAEFANNSGSVDTVIDLSSNNATVAINGNLVIDLDNSSDIILDASSNPLTVQGDIIDEITGGGTLVADGQDLTFTGTNAQDVDLMGATWGAVVENKPSETVTLSGALNCGSFTGTDGDLDCNGQTVVSSGNVDWASGFTLNPGDADSLNGCSWTVQGNFTCDGQTLNAKSAWSLDVTGSAVASGVGSVQFSDASDGTEIDASDGPWVDGGNNTNWNFGLVPVGPWDTPWEPAAFAVGAWR